MACATTWGYGDILAQAATHPVVLPQLDSLLMSKAHAWVLSHQPVVLLLFDDCAVIGTMPICVACIVTWGHGVVWA